MKNIITEKYRVTNKELTAFIYIIFFEFIENVDYKIFYNRYDVLDFLKTSKDDIRYIAKIKETYKDELIKKEKERIEYIEAKNYSYQSIISENEKAEKYLKEIDAIIINSYNIKSIIKDIENNEDF